MGVKFSIVVPVYNVAPYLRDCLNSVIEQTYADWELICIDDGSTDGSDLILDEYSKTDARIRVVHKIKSGVSAARNDGLLACSGEYVGFVDADDVLLKDWLKAAARCLEKGEVDFVRLSPTFWTGKSGPNDIEEEGECDSQRYAGRNLWRWFWRDVFGAAWVWLCFVRREVILRNNVRFPIGVPIHEDTVFMMRLLLAVRSSCQSSYAGYLYRQRSGSGFRSVRLVEQVIRLATEVSMCSLELIKSGMFCDKQIREISEREVSSFLFGNFHAWFLYGRHDERSKGRYVIDYLLSVRRQPLFNINALKVVLRIIARITLCTHSLSAIQLYVYVNKLKHKIRLFMRQDNGVKGANL